MDVIAKPSEPQRKLNVFRGIQPFARDDDRGGAVRVNAIHEDEGAIRAMADRLQRAGYGVLRERSPRAGRVYYRLNATWADDGEPPADPLAGGG
ncbi:hypothetical protein OJF2_66090 [Aquisphaera giovannonii]|uniref:Uncharacterized protein n=1 Tax=Aquisphaera giovannonii TaxID=406548 RepID=A0A5B9WC06_9BACT|nr:hypothetical protein [Aquisphaera giovannonii]QEH38013.1 hypothetical protein OJF2_66090 [Aquisphaera giovannonii]